MDMTPTVIPKSDQINVDDLLAGPRTVTVTKVTANEGNPEQPVNVFFDGDNGKPFRPCKSMRRVMIAVWGPDAAQYVGRSMTLYRDPDVTWGGMKVGGIRISHMSDIDREQVLALTATKSSRKPYRVQPLKAPHKRPQSATRPEVPNDTPPPDIGAPDAPQDEGQPVTVSYQGSDGTVEDLPLEMAIRKVRAAHRKADADAWHRMWLGNREWLDQHAPDVAAELGVRVE